MSSRPAGRDLASGGGRLAAPATPAGPMQRRRYMAKHRREPRNRYALRITRRGVLIAGIFGCLVAIGIAYLVLADGSDADEQPALRQEPVVTDALQADVRVVDRDYKPRDLTVPMGATVTWVWEGDEPHNVIDDRGAFESPILDNGDDWSMTFDAPDEYYYYCSLHHAMQGTIRVAE